MVLEVLAEAPRQRFDVRMRVLAALDAPIDAVPEFKAGRGSEQRLHDRGLGSAVADDDERRVFEQRHQGLHQRRIERLRFADQIAIRVLLGLAVEPNDLHAREQAELVEIVRSPVDLGDVPDVWGCLSLRAFGRLMSKLVVRIVPISPRRTNSAVAR
jgi:hypothetical protein